MPERVPVGARAEVAGLQAATRALLLRRPRSPPVAAELRELLERARAVDERAQLPDRLRREAADRALGDHRRAVRHREAHLVARQRQRVHALLGLHPRPRVANRPEHVAVLGADAALREGQVVGHRLRAMIGEGGDAAAAGGLPRSRWGRAGRRCSEAHPAARVYARTRARRGPRACNSMSLDVPSRRPPVSGHRPRSTDTAPGAGTAIKASGGAACHRGAVRRG